MALLSSPSFFFGLRLRSPLSLCTWDVVLSLTSNSSYYFQYKYKIDVLIVV